MQNRIEWEARSMGRTTNQIAVIADGEVGCMVSADEETEFYDCYLLDTFVASWVTIEQGRRAVEAAFEQWLERSGLQWKDSPAEEKEA